MNQAGYNVLRLIDTGFDQESIKGIISGVE